MIEINLLPEELKAKSKKSAKAMKSMQILYFIPLAFGILIIVHLYLSSVIIAGNIRLGLLDNKWQSLKPQRQMLEDSRKGYQGLSQDDAAVQQLAKEGIMWAKKLNKLSLNLPAGIWFNEISVSPKDFILKGSVVSLQQEEMNAINKFMDNLKKDSVFLKDFSNLELTSVQKKVIGGYDIADFVLSAKLK